MRLEKGWGCGSASKDVAGHPLTLVAATQHRGEGLDLLLATTLLTGLLVIALGANALDDVLAIELLLHAADRTVDGLVFADFDLDRRVVGKCLKAKKT